MLRPRRRLAAAFAVAVIIGGFAWLVWPPGDAGRPPSAARPPEPAPDASSLPAGAWAQSTPPPSGVPAAASTAAPPSAAVFEGRLVSADAGEGIAGGELVFSRAGEANPVRTGVDGAFRFATALAGRWTLAAATAPGFFPFAPEWGHSPVVLEARPGVAVGGLVVRLAPAREYLGLVTDDAGRAVAGAEVRVRAGPTGSSTLVATPDRFTSGADGSFRFVAPDGALVEARHALHAPAVARVDWRVRATQRLTLALGPAPAGDAPAGRIAGRVEDAAGAPAAGALVQAFAERRRGGAVPASATADAQGRFELASLPAARYTLTASRPGLAPGAQRGVEPGAADVVLRLRAGGAVEGRVRERGGAPVTSFTVVVRARGREGRLAPSSWAVVDPEGRYRADGLPPGPAWVAVAAAGRPPTDEVEVTVPDPGAAPASADFELAAGAGIHGVVVDGATREPLRGAAVAVEGFGAPGPAPLSAAPGALSGADGRFELTGVPPGPLSLQVTAEAHHGRLVGGLVAREDAPVGPIAVTLTPLQPGEEPRLELAGIGAVLAPRRGALVVASVVPGGGAAAAGLAPGDEVVRVDGQPVSELGFAATVDLVRGPEGSTVVLGIRKRGDPQRTELRVVVERRLVRD